MVTISTPALLTDHYELTMLQGALRSGAEDVFPGDIAQDWLARWRDNPKALERELAHAQL